MSRSILTAAGPSSIFGRIGLLLLMRRLGQGWCRPGLSRSVEVEGIVRLLVCMIGGFWLW